MHAFKGTDENEKYCEREKEFPRAIVRRVIKNSLYAGRDQRLHVILIIFQ